jgi:uncharacterized protein YneF (UPF0154 family)
MVIMAPKQWLFILGAILCEGLGLVKGKFYITRKAGEINVASQR